MAAVPDAPGSCRAAVHADAAGHAVGAPPEDASPPSRSPIALVAYREGECELTAQRREQAYENIRRTMEWLLEFKQAEVAPGTSKAEAQRLSHYLLDNLLDFVQLSTTGQPTPSSPKGSPDNDASWKLRLAHRFECFHSAPDCREAQQELGNALARAPDSVGGPQSGLHAAAAVGLKPRPPTGSAPQPSGLRRLRSSRLLGAAPLVPPPAVGPGAAVEVSQCVKEEWRLNDAPGGRPIEDAAARYIRALEDTVQRIESGTTANRVVKFIERLPRALREIVPGAEGWLRDDDVTTNEVWTTASERVSYKPGFWERRASGLLSMLHDLLQRIAEFVQWVNAERLWNAEHESIRELVYKAKANDKKKDKDEPLSDEAKADLVDRAQQDVKCLCALLRRWDTATALDMTVCAFLYCGNMSPLRFRERPFDRHGRPDDQYKGAPPGKSNSHCQVFYVWNKALRELADPSIGGPEGETPRGKKERMECNRKVVKLFEPMTHLLTELIHTLAAREPMVVSRGIDVRLSEKYVQGNTVAMPSFWSASRNPSKSYELVGPSTGTWFIFHTVRAASMQWCALFLSERECLFPPSITTKVILKFSDVLLWAVGTKKENMKDLVFLRDSLMPDWDLETLVKHSCEVLMQCGRLSVFGPFCKTYGRMRCTVFEGDGPSCGEDLEVFEVLKRFLSSKVVHVMVLTGAGDEITRALVALAHGACQPAAGWVPFFDGLGEIPRLLEQEGSYREHIKKVLLTCHDPDRAFEILLRQRVLHALDGLQDVVKPGAATWPAWTQLLRYMGLNASPLQKVCIGYDAAQVSARGGPRAKMSELHDGRVWRVHILGVDENGSREFAVRCSGGDRSSHESDSQGPGGPSGPGPPGGSDGGGSQSGGGPGAAPPGGAPHQLARTFSKLHKDHPALAKIPFVNEMVADLVLQSGDHARWARVEAHQSFLWELTSEWCLLHVQREIKQELELDQPAVVTAAAQVAVVFSVLLTLTGTRYCSLGPVAAVLADPTRVRDDPLRFSIKLSEKERKQLANHLEFLLGLGGVPKEWVRDLLCVLPLRSSNIEADGGLCSFQHKIVADWTLALWFSMALSCPADACPPAALVYHFASPCCQASFTLLAERAVSDARLAAQLGRALCLRHHAEQQHGGVHAHTDPFTPMRRVSARLLHQTAPRRIQSLIESAIAEGQRRALYPAATAHTKAEEGRHAKEQTERTRGQAAELAELRRGKEAAETEVILLRAEMAQLRAAHKQKQGEVHEANEQLQRKVAQATSEAAQQREDNDKLQAAVAELTIERDELRSAVYELTAERDELLHNRAAGSDEHQVTARPSDEELQESQAVAPSGGQPQVTRMDSVPKLKQLKGKLRGHADIAVKAAHIMRADPSEPSVQELGELADACRDPHSRELVMQKIWKRLRWTGQEVKGKDWQQCWRALRVLRSLCLRGPEAVAEEARAKRELLHILSTDFQTTKPQNSRKVREQARVLHALLTSSGYMVEKARDEAAKRQPSGRVSRTGSSFVSDGDSAFVQQQMERFQSEEPADTRELSVCKENDGSVDCTVGQCIVIRVGRGSLAQKAGLRRGMLITQVQHTPVSTYESWKLCISEAPRDFRVFVMQLREQDTSPSISLAPEPEAEPVEDPADWPQVPPQRDWLSELLGLPASSPSPSTLPLPGAIRIAPPLNIDSVFSAPMPGSGLELPSVNAAGLPSSIPSPSRKPPAGIALGSAVGRVTSPPRGRRPSGSQATGAHQSPQHRDYGPAATPQTPPASNLASPTEASDGQGDAPESTRRLEVYCFVTPSYRGIINPSVRAFFEQPGQEELLGQVVGFDVENDPKVHVSGKEPRVIPRRLVEVWSASKTPPPHLLTPPQQPLQAARGAHSARSDARSSPPAPAHAAAGAGSVGGSIGGGSGGRSARSSPEGGRQPGVGDRVMAEWGGSWYEARILAVRHGRFDVDWMNGEFTRGLERNQLRPLATGSEQQQNPTGADEGAVIGLTDSGRAPLEHSVGGQIGGVAGGPSNMASSASSESGLQGAPSGRLHRVKH
eukprot:TRINITY_DN5373_c0_g1_i2.p1 TRINITY_DN5373_c0_g1~~TRINITY_DN5373_c0_g1_i2.p1  ORF type:complete len:2062 (+),score=246.36 TRINITY_DN5373_c0_g1_i2:76-6186(+)